MAPDPSGQLTVELMRACARNKRDYIVDLPKVVLRVVALKVPKITKNAYKDPADLLYEVPIPSGLLMKGMKYSIPLSVSKDLDPKRPVVVRICEQGTDRCLMTTGRFPNRIQFVENMNFPIQVYQKRLLKGKMDPDCDSVLSSPLVLDLDNDGIVLSGPERGVRFDLNATGSKMRTGWVTSGRDAFLSLDLNGNGRIDSGAELFGDSTLLPDGNPAANGFEALAQYDSNHDGYITDLDPVFSRLRLWMDFNHNGISEPGELFSLESENIRSIYLDYRVMEEEDSHGNRTIQRSVFEKAVGKDSLFFRVVDIWFKQAP